ncbi:MAG: DNA (cytosine-5-)-methyltransferase, partial [Candidatus Thiodiazotropha endolucinida]
MIPVIDLFAGAGGLGEGFSAFLDEDISPFGLKLAMEKDDEACRTLEVRAFFRKFSAGNVPHEYYRLLKGEIGINTLFRKHPDEARAARNEVRCVELGATDTAESTIDMWIERALGNSTRWVLTGGPPCQAFSIAGRGRNRAVPGYVPED